MNTTSLSDFSCPYCKAALHTTPDGKSGDNTRTFSCENNHSFTTLHGVPFLIRQEDILAESQNEAFENLAREYEKTVDSELGKYWGIGFLEFMDRICTRVVNASPKRVLDIASNIAQIPMMVLERLPDVRFTCIDVTSPMIETSRGRIAGKAFASNVELAYATGTNVPFPDASFDMVTCALGVHHMNAREFVDEARRVLSHRGKLIISDAITSPFFRSLPGRALLSVLLLQYYFSGNPAMARVEKKALARMKTTFEWKRLLEQSGFEKIVIESIRPRNPIYPGGMILQATRI